MQLKSISPEHTGVLFYAWDNGVKEHVKRALEKTNVNDSPEFYLGKILTKEMQLYVMTDDENNINGIVVTQFVLDGNVKCCQVVLLSGINMKEWLIELVDRIVSFARKEQCQVLMLEGRRGWIRELKPLGFEEMTIKMAKRLDEQETSSTDDNPENRS